MDQINEKVNVKVQAFVPLMTQSQYAELSGLTPDSVKAQVINGHLPTVKIGKYRMINIVGLVDLAKQSMEVGV